MLTFRAPLGGLHPDGSGSVLQCRGTVRHCSTELKRTSFACGRSEAAEAAGGWLHRLRATAQLQCATVDEAGAGEAVPNRCWD